MGEGPECCRRAEWPLGRRLERVTALVPLLLTGVRHTTRSGGPTRSSADASVPRLAGFSPDHLSSLDQCVSRVHPGQALPAAEKCHLRVPHLLIFAFERLSGIQEQGGYKRPKESTYSLRTVYTEYAECFTVP